MPDPPPPPGIESLTVPDWFQPFSPRWSDPGRMTETYRRKLPHWRYEGATYFVTFRLHDSLPRAVAAALHEEAAAWLRRIAAERTALGGLLSATTREAWEEFQREHFRHLDSHLDECHGSCLLRRAECRDIVAEALAFFEGERCRVGAYVIMPNHVHVLCAPLPGCQMESLAGSWKQHSARRLNALLGTRGRHWQPETHDRLVRDGDHFRRAVRYLVNNPAKARLRESEATVWLAPELRRR